MTRATRLQFGGEVKVPTLPQRTREGWGTRFLLVTDGKAKLQRSFDWRSFASQTPASLRMTRATKLRFAQDDKGYKTAVCKRSQSSHSPLRMREGRCHRSLLSQVPLV